MAVTEDIDRPRAALPVARRYLGRERSLSALVVALVVAVFVGTLLVTSLLAAIAVGAVLVAALRAPLFRPQGTVRLRTDDDPASVVDSFAGPTPPVLPFHWGIADEITARDGAVTYHTSYLLGLRSVDVAVCAETDTTPGGARRVELELTADGRPWASYTVTVDRSNGETVVAYEYTSTRRFGLRRVPQRIVAARYRDEALEAQGYTVVARDESYYAG